MKLADKQMNSMHASLETLCHAVEALKGAALELEGLPWTGFASHHLHLLAMEASDVALAIQSELSRSSAGTNEP